MTKESKEDMIGIVIVSVMILLFVYYVIYIVPLLWVADSQ